MPVARTVAPAAMQRAATLVVQHLLYARYPTTPCLPPLALSLSPSLSLPSHTVGVLPSDTLGCRGMQGAVAQLAMMMSMMGQTLDGDGSGLPGFLEQMGDEVSAIAQQPTPRDGADPHKSTAPHHAHAPY